MVIAVDRRVARRAYTHTSHSPRPLDAALGVRGIVMGNRSQQGMCTQTQHRDRGRGRQTTAWEEMRHGRSSTPAAASMHSKMKRAPVEGSRWCKRCGSRRRRPAPHGTQRALRWPRGAGIRVSAHHWILCPARRSHSGGMYAMIPPKHPRKRRIALKRPLRTTPSLRRRMPKGGSTTMSGELCVNQHGVCKR